MSKLWFPIVFFAPCDSLLIFDVFISHCHGNASLVTTCYCCHSKHSEAICFHGNLLSAQPAVDAHIAEASGNQGNQAGSSAPSMTTGSGRHDNPDSLETNNQSQSGKQVCIPWQPKHAESSLTANIITSKSKSHNANTEFLLSLRIL